MIVNQEVVEYVRNLVSDKYSMKVKELEDYALLNHVPIIQKEALEILLFLIKNNKVKNILELGCAIGYSAISMAKVDEEIRIDTLDRDKEAIEIAKNNFINFNVENRISLYEGEINDNLEAFIKDKAKVKKYDLIFIDAGKSHYLDYLKLSLPLLKEDGLIFCDNVLFRGEVSKKEIENKKNASIIKRMRDFLSYVTNNDKLDSCIIPCADGIMLIRKK